MPRLQYSRPPETLAEELNEVARDAAALSAELKRQNRLPPDFPAEQLADLLAELQTLNSGTAEGCREPLTYARARLPQIRRENILTEARSAGHDATGDEPPPLTRGMTIDRLLTTLIGSVTTALDEYRRLAGEAPAEEPDTAPSQRLDQDAPDVKAADAAAAKAEGVLTDAQREASDILKPDSARGDDLKRQMSDARGLFRLSRIELKMPAFVGEWYRRTVGAIKDYPALLTRTANAIRVGADVADIANGIWSRFQDRGFKVVTDTVRDVADQLEAFAKRKSKSGVSAEPPAAPHPGTPPPDFDLDAVHDMILRGEEPPEPWRPWVTRLRFNYYITERGAPSADRIAELSALADLAPLANLQALQTLWLDNTQVADLAPIANLQALQTLYLNATQVADLAPIANLQALQTLWLDNTHVADLAPIANLQALQTLSLNATQVADLVPIANLQALQTLSLVGTQVADLAPIANLQALQTLFLNGTQVADLAPIANLQALQTLSLDSTQVADLAPIAALPNLEAVYVAPGRVRALARTLGRPGIVKVAPWAKPARRTPAKKRAKKKAAAKKSVKKKAAAKKKTGASPPPPSR